MTEIGTRKIDQVNRVSIPPEIMKFLNLKPKDYVCFDKTNENVCIFKAYLCVKRNNCKPKNGEAVESGTNIRRE